MIRRCGGLVRTVAAAAVLLLSAGPATASSLSTGIAGYWLKISGDRNNAVIEIYRNGTHYDGRIVKLEYPSFIAGEDSAAGPVPPALAGHSKTDLLNEDPSLRNRSIEGMEIISGFIPDGDRKWSDATIYNPEDGKTYHCKATLSSDGKQLTVRGYVGVPMFGRSQTWKRLDSPTDVDWPAPPAAK